MAPRGRLEVFRPHPVALEDAMPPLMLPETFLPLAAAFAPCFTAPTYRLFCYVVAGWVRCVGRHTVTGVALAAWRADTGGVNPDVNSLAVHGNRLYVVERPTGPTGD